MLGTMYGATFAYFIGTLTTIEKRFKIPSRNLGIISTGYDFSAIIMAPVLGHYFANKHRPRLIGICFGIFAVIALAPPVLHLAYGPGNDALSLTVEYSLDTRVNETISESLCRSESMLNIYF